MTEIDRKIDGDSTRDEAEARRARPWWIKPVIGIAVLTFILLAGPVYGRLASGGKISPEIDREAQQVDVIVRVAFPPAIFHSDLLSDFGVFSGRDLDDDTVLKFRAVKQDDLERIANFYWVESIEPLP